MEDYNIDDLLKNIKPNLHKSYNGIFLTDEEVSVLNYMVLILINIVI